jgi:hypothetical protein
MAIKHSSARVASHTKVQSTTARRELNQHQQIQLSSAAIQSL